MWGVGLRVRVYVEGAEEGGEGVGVLFQKVALPLGRGLRRTFSLYSFLKRSPN
jgi:hypothetical protein